MSHNRNTHGKNQHEAICKCLVSCDSSLGPLSQYIFLFFWIAKADDKVLSSALRQSHRELLTNNKKISARLFSEHGIKMR